MSREPQPELLQPSVAPAGEQASTPRPRKRPTKAKSGDAGIDRDELLRRYYRQVYRPKHDPLRFATRVRVEFGGVGRTPQTQGGRVLGISADAGLQWNFVGAHLEAVALFGDLWVVAAPTSKTTGQLAQSDHPNLRSRSLLGGGPRIGIGRLGHTSKGYLDPRIGYSVLHTRTAEAIEKSKPASRDVLIHGPDIRIDMGFFFHDTIDKARRHALGMSIGWHYLIGTKANPVPNAHLVTLGLTYSAS